jgi:Skp family chaperone for outer membrane proteins
MRAMLWMGGVVFAVAALVGAGRLAADGDDNKNETPRTRIGLVNLTYAIKNYYKFKDFQEEIKDIVAPYQQTDAHLRRQHEKLRAEAERLEREASEGGKKAILANEKREALEIKGKQLQRELEDNSAEIKSKLEKLSNEEMRILFRDVEEAVKRYATKHDLDVVLQYNDAITREDLLSSQNIARKLQSGALMPIYSTAGIDISKDITDLLNRNRRKKS